MLLDVFLEGLFEMDLRRVNSEEVSEEAAVDERYMSAAMEIGPAGLPLLCLGPSPVVLFQW